MLQLFLIICIDYFHLDEYRTTVSFKLTGCVIWFEIFDNYILLPQTEMVAYIIRSVEPRMNKTVEKNIKDENLKQASGGSTRDRLCFLKCERRDRL